MCSASAGCCSCPRRSLALTAKHRCVELSGSSACLQSWAKDPVPHDGHMYTVQYDRDPVALLKSFMTDKEVLSSRAASRLVIHGLPLSRQASSELCRLPQYAGIIAGGSGAHAPL